MSTKVHTESCDWSVNRKHVNRKHRWPVSYYNYQSYRYTKKRQNGSKDIHLDQHIKANLNQKW